MSKPTIVFKVEMKWWWPVLLPVWLLQKIAGKEDAYLPRCVLKITRQ